VETESSNETSINVAIVRGVCSSPPEIRVLPSEQRLAQLQVTTRVDGRAMSVPVSVIDPPAWIDQLDAGDELIVIGAVRRRFFRAAGSTASRVEIEAEIVARARDRRRSRRLANRVAEVLEALES